MGAISTGSSASTGYYDHHRGRRNDLWREPRSLVGMAAIATGAGLGISIPLAKRAAAKATVALPDLQRANRDADAMESRTLSRPALLREAKAMVNAPGARAWTDMGDEAKLFVTGAGSAAFDDRSEALAAARMLRGGGSVGTYSAGGKHVPLAFDDPLDSVMHLHTTIIDKKSYTIPRWHEYGEFTALHPNVSTLETEGGDRLARLGHSQGAALADAERAIAGGKWKPPVYGVAGAAAVAGGVYLLGRGMEWWD